LPTTCPFDTPDSSRPPSRSRHDLIEAGILVLIVIVICRRLAATSAGDHIPVTIMARSPPWRRLVFTINTRTISSRAGDRHRRRHAIRHVEGVAPKRARMSSPDARQPGDEGAVGPSSHHSVLNSVFPAAAFVPGLTWPRFCPFALVIAATAFIMR